MTTITNTTPVKIPTISIEVLGATITATFSNGKILSLDASELSADIRHEAMMHGLKQKMGDASAIARNTTTGASASVQDKFDAMAEVVERITSEGGTWTKVREGGAGGGSSLLQRALMELTGKTREAIAEFLEEKSKEEKAALKNNPRVAAIIARLQAATVNKGIDSDELLGELEG